MIDNWDVMRDMIVHNALRPQQNRPYGLLSILYILEIMGVIDYDTVFEIKGAPCIRCAHFGCQVHIFKDLCTLCILLSNIIIHLNKEEHMVKLPGAWFLATYAPGVCTIYM